MTSDERNFATFAHLAAFFGYVVPVIGRVLGPVIIWLIKKEEYPFVDQQGREAINFNLSMLIYALILAPTLCIGIGIVILPLLGLAHIILIILAAVKSNSGTPYRYPVTIRFLS